MNERIYNFHKNDGKIMRKKAKGEQENFKINKC